MVDPDLNSKFIRIGDLMLEELKEIAERAKRAITHMNFKHFEEFFAIKECFDGWYARCKVCGVQLANSTDWLLYESMTLHLMKHTDEFIKLAEMLYKIGKLNLL